MPPSRGVCGSSFGPSRDSRPRQFRCRLSCHGVSVSDGSIAITNSGWKAWTTDAVASHNRRSRRNKSSRFGSGMKQDRVPRIRFARSAALTFNAFSPTNSASCDRWLAFIICCIAWVIHTLRPRPRHRLANPQAQEDFKLGLPARLLAVRDAHPGKQLRVYFQDESRFGQQGTTTKLWALLGSRPTAVRQTEYQYLWVLGTVGSLPRGGCGGNSGRTNAQSASVRSLSYDFRAGGFMARPSWNMI